MNMDEVSPHRQGPGCGGDSTEEVQRLSLPNLMSDVVEHQLYMYGAAGMHPPTITKPQQLEALGERCPWPQPVVA